jgi:hypothetical protein
MAHITKNEEGELILRDDWCIEDVHSAAGDLGQTITDDQAEDILVAVADSHDCNIGINWELFYYHLERIEDVG